MKGNSRGTTTLCPHCGSRMRVLSGVERAGVNTMRRKQCLSEKDKTCGVVIKYIESPMHTVTESANPNPSIDIPLAR